MHNLTNQELLDIGVAYVQDKLSWDEIAIKNGVARSTMIKRVKDAIGVELYKKWQEFRKDGLAFIASNLLPKAQQPKKQQQQKKKKQTITPVTEPTQQITYVAHLQPDDKILVNFYFGDQEVQLITSEAELPMLQLLAKKASWDELVELSNAMNRITKVSGITFDKVAKEFSLNGIPLPQKYEQVVVNAYNEYLQSGNNNSLSGLISLVHRLNVSNRMDKFEQLYEFLKHTDITILKDGRFVGYKYLKEIPKGFADAYTGQIVQKAGDYIYTHEEQVNPDPTVTCSYGLHVGAWNYVSDQKWIAKVIVNPEDVVSVPNDYNGMKLRTKGYSIVEILDFPKLEDFADAEGFMPSNFIYVQATK